MNRKLFGIIGLDDLRFQAGDFRRLAVLVLVCVACALLVVEYGSAPRESLQVGDVAPRTIKAPYNFTFKNLDAYERQRAEASALELQVYRFQPGIGTERKDRIHAAFDNARTRLIEAKQALPVPQVEEGTEPVAPVVPDEVAQSIKASFTGDLGVRLPPADVSVLYDAAFPAEAEDLAADLVGRAMARMVVRTRAELPDDRRPIRVIEEKGLERSERIVRDYADTVTTPDDVRQTIALQKLDSQHAQAIWADASAKVARAMVRTNIALQPEWTRERRAMAAAAVELQLEQVKRGAILFRQGDILTELDLVKYQALQQHQGDQNLALEILAIALFLLLLLSSLYQFGASYLPGFSTRSRDIATAGVLLVLVAALARGGVAMSSGIANLVGNEAEPESIWFFVPVAGAAMLVRLLMGVSWTVVFSVAASVLCGLVMDLQALVVVFFLLASVAGAGAIEGTRERIAVLRAGVYTGIISAACVLLIHFLKLFVLEGEVTLATTMRPVWSMTFAFAGGVLSSFLVLGLVPVFEAVGFVTDYRLMELANLNHPLMRQVMLRAPGTYHHSVMVGSLAEAGCEAIGANALQAKVASYFHDIGKQLKPAYFVENQKGVNKHDALDPYTSAQIIINHVIDGGRMAKEYGLPKPIIDNIYMHHGTGLLVYFYKLAREQASDPTQVDEADFRYPGPKPNTREAGVIMLADKVEAATRTLKQPTEPNVRAMINKIINSTIQDGQFSECPLTLQEIYLVAEVFVNVLMGIYHQRIEYPDTAQISQRLKHKGTPISAPSRSAVITLDVAPQQPAPWSERDVPAPGEIDSLADYESVANLPAGQSGPGSDSKH